MGQISCLATMLDLTQGTRPTSEMTPEDRHKAQALSLRIMQVMENLAEELDKQLMDRLKTQEPMRPFSKQAHAPATASGK